MRDRILKWFFFTLVVSVLPMVCTSGFIWGWDKTFSLNKLLDTGELLTIVAALAATAMGDVLFAKKKRSKEKIVCAFACCAIVLVAILWDLLVTLKIHEGRAYNQNYVVWGSILLYCLTALNAAYCVAISE